MKLPRDLAGEELVKLLCKHFGYVRVNQEGSRQWSVVSGRWSLVFGPRSTVFGHLLVP